MNMPSVSFGNVHVRCFDRIAGDHPDVSDRGPPLSIGWAFCEGETMTLDKFETMRGPHCKMQPLSGELRRNILLYGFKVSQEEIRTMEAEVERTKKQRSQTIKQRSLSEKIERAIESTTRKLTGRSSSKSRNVPWDKLEKMNQSKLSNRQIRSF